MSEWKAGDDSENEEAQTHKVYKRLTKGEKQRLEDESEYQLDEHTTSEKKHKQRGSTSPKHHPSKDGSTVYSTVMEFIRAKETTLGSGSQPSTTPGRGVTSDLATQPFYIAGATMHPHQISGLNWLKSRFEMGMNAILADEMGLGKTLTSISFLAYLQELAMSESGKANNGKAAAASSSSSSNVRVGPFLVVCPLTVLDNWANELSNFAPSLIVQSYSGTKAEREELQEDIRAFIRTQPKEQRKDPLLPFHVLLTTYDYINNDVEFLSKFQFRVAIIDEAHRLKNHESVLSQTLMNEFKIGWKLCLTGTPVQNSLNELWSLLWFLHPKVFNNKTQFLDEFELLSNTHRRALKESQALLSDAERTAQSSALMDQLHEILRPFLLRRLKDECDLNIPPKREIIIKTRLTDLQKDIYKNVLLKNYDLIGSASQKGGSTRALLNIVLSLRKCATHPYLFPGVEPEPFEEGPHIYQASGKFAVLYKLLKVLKKLKRRVLLFSTSVQTLDIVQDALSYMRYSYERLDGSVRGEERYMAIERFTKTQQQAEETFVFLLSTRAGGVGLNLTCADTVIFLDADWNPQIDLQAQARAHRIGQKKEVLIIRMVASNTVEEIIQKRTMKKLLMTHNILEKGKFNLSKKRTDIDYSMEDEDVEEKKSNSKADVDENEAIGRSTNDLKNILQYGLDHLLGDQAQNDDELKEDEIEAIVTGRIAEQQAASSKAKPSTVSAMEIDGAPPSSPAKATRASAAAAASSATAAARPAFNRIQTVALPSLDEAASLAPTLVTEEEEPSVYVFEGTDFKELQQRNFENLDDELSTSAHAGSKLLQQLVDNARSLNMTAEYEDGYGPPSGADGSRKRKAVLQETDEERAARVQRNKEIAQKRMESARKRHEEAELVRKEALDAKWSVYQYQSASIQLDEALEVQFAEESDQFAADAQPASDSQVVSEWMAGDEEEEERKVSDAPISKAKLHYVIGDATCPFVFQREDGQEGTTSTAPDDAPTTAASSATSSSTSAASHSAANAVVFIPVDASGRWGKGGLFRALDNRSVLVGQQYELIGEMEDLAMGDAHIVKLEPDQLKPTQSFPPQPPAPLQVALCAVLKRAKNQQYGPPSLQPDSLALTFKKLSQYAHTHQLSVHLPRIGSNDQNIQWYAIERLLNKHLVARGINVYVYYFQRRRPQYRSPVKTQLARTNSSFSQRTMSSDSMPPTATPSSQRALSFENKRNSSPAPAAAAAASTQPIVVDDDTDESAGPPAPIQPQLSVLSQFHDVFTGCVIYIHNPSTSSTTNPSDDERLLTRYIMAYDGEVVKTMNPKVTHIVTGEPFLTPELLNLKKLGSQRIRIVQLSWTEACVKAGRLDDSIKWQVAPAPKA